MDTGSLNSWPPNLRHLTFNWFLPISLQLHFVLDFLLYQNFSSSCILNQERCQDSWYFFSWIYLFPPLKDVVLLHPSHQLLLPDKSSLGRDAIYFCPMLHKMKMVLMHITKSWTGFHLAPTLFSQFNIVSKGWEGTQIHHSSLTWRSKHWGLARSCSCPGEDRSLLQDFLSVNSFTIILPAHPNIDQSNTFYSLPNISNSNSLSRFRNCGKVGFNTHNPG